MLPAPMAAGLLFLARRSGFFQAKRIAIAPPITPKSLPARRFSRWRSGGAPTPVHAAR
jgi:hypothetical protein